jgi:hypothetical protein
MTMTRTALTSFLALALAAGAAQAQPRGPLAGNIVGGGDASISGGGDNLTVTYNTGGAGDGGGVLSQPGRFARFAGNDGDGPRVEYLSPAPTNPGREAWLLGGGDNAEVVYVRPR